MHTPLAVLFALATAVANALATVLQRKAARDVPVRGGLQWGLIAELLRRRVWLAGIAVVGAAAALQALALANGPISVVQPVFVLELPAALLLGGLLLRRPLTGSVWWAAACVTVGLVVALGAASPGLGSPDAKAGRWLPVLLALLSVAAVLAAVAALRRPGAARAALLALAAAICYAVTAALLKSAVFAWRADGVAGFLTAWQTYGFALVGVAALFLLSNALQSGPLVFSQPALTLGDAGVSLLLGGLLFGERIRTGWWVLAELAGAALVVVGVLLLSRSAQAHDLIAPPADEGAAPAR